MKSKWCQIRVLNPAMLAAAATPVLIAAASASAQLRVVDYNIAQLVGNQAALEDVFAALQDDDKPGFAVAVSVFVFQEVQVADVAPLLSMINATAPAGVTYVAGTYTNESKDGFGGAQAMFYRSDLLEEDASQHDDMYTGAGRFTDRWRLDLVGYTSPHAGFYIYSSHLKANPGAADEQERLNGVINIREDADALGAGQHIIYCGDMNFYDNGETGYLHFLSSGAGQAFDPLGTGSWAGAANAFKHSQSPRLAAGGGLVGGGLDDRFDFQLATAAFQDNAGLARLGGTYRSLGNDGMHFDQSINNGNNFYYPDDVPRSNALANDLFIASDHLPLVVEYQIPAVMVGTIPANYGRVIQNAAFSIQTQVINDADVAVVQGADELSFNAVGSQGLSGSFSDTVLPLGDVSSFSFSLNTSVVGPRTGRVSLTSSSQGVKNPAALLETSGTIVRHANGSFSGSSDINQLTVHQSYEASSGSHVIAIDVHNLGFDSLQALLDIDDVSDFPKGSPFQFTGGLANGIGGSPASLTFAFNTDGLPSGVYEAPATIALTDEDLPGATASSLDLTLQVTIDSGQPCAEDVTHDGIVNVSDLLAVIAAWGDTGASSADVNGDQVVNVSDLLAVIAGWGSCP